MNIMTTTTAPSLRTPEGLRAWRAAHGVSQRQLADLLEVGWKGTLSRYENGHLAIPRVIELALRGLEAELATTPDLADEAPAAVAGDLLIADLISELISDVASLDEIVAFRDVHDAADIEGAAAGDKLAMIRLRKACGLPTFKESR